MALSRISLNIGIASALALAGVGGVLAQGKSGGSAVPIDPSGSFEISGVAVDVRGKDANSARMGGWRLAQRKGWEMLAQRLTGKSSSLSDSALDSLVTAVVVEREQIGPTRYIARLGVLFDRQKAGAVLGVSTALSRSAPMLLVPLEFSGGAGIVFERETAWARAWTRFRSGGSTIDYVRVRGTGPDSLLINAGQTLRRGRNWWRSVLDQYGAADVLVAEVQLRREYPGGPIVGVFAANHGPDRRPIAAFALRVDNGDSLDALLDAGILRIDKAFQAALSTGELATDRMLATRPPVPKVEEEEPADEETPTATPTATVETGTSFTVQVETPNVNALNASESAVRGVPGVRGATTTSLALGGISVMRVTYDGPIGSLRAALEARGWQVQEGGGVLRIRRPQGSQAPAPGPQPSPSPAAPTD
ncbi:heavy-metal-associated domain-containing protein [Sphingomonas sp.]|uniref:heavy-metal-associated domain-containing protein n=1 Tax=Sphingomonas sp. TaxID=28214 RepID=UPI002ED8B919